MGESEIKEVEVEGKAVKKAGWVEGSSNTGYLSVNAATLEAGQEGLDLSEWTEKGWIAYLDFLGEIEEARLGKPYEGGVLRLLFRCLLGIDSCFIPFCFPVKELRTEENLKLDRTTLHIFIIDSNSYIRPLFCTPKTPTHHHLDPGLHATTSIMQSHPSSFAAGPYPLNSKITTLQILLNVTSPSNEQPPHTLHNNWYSSHARTKDT